MRNTLIWAVILGFAGGAWAEEPKGLFAPSNLKTASGGYADPDMFYEAGDCGECHEVIYNQWKGSVHSRAHEDKLYRAFAELARKEGGDDLYRFCSSCHSPLGVTTGQIAGPNQDKQTWITKEGVTCDACHTVKEVRRAHKGVPANASFTIDDESEMRYGPNKDLEESDMHEHGYSEVHGKAEFCSGCHTLVHPHNGLVIENTYREWKDSPLAKSNFQCKDCHMRIVEQAKESISALAPIKTPGALTGETPERENVYAHLFTGANVNREAVGMGEWHAREAERRLKMAAAMALDLPEDAGPGKLAKLSVVIVNGGAGHHIPSSITELRQVWVDLTVTDAKGDVVYRSGTVDDTGKVDPEAVMFNAVLGDKDGNVTYLPWRAEKVLSERLIHAGGREDVKYTFEIPEDAAFPLMVEAVLQYRSAPQDILDELFGKGEFQIKTVAMADAKGLIKKARAEKE